MNHWEYKIEKAAFSSGLERSLNDWGSRGWEVIAMTGISGAVTLTGNKIFVIMKRPVIGTPALKPELLEWVERLETQIGGLPVDQTIELVESLGPELLGEISDAVARSGFVPSDPTQMLHEVANMVRRGSAIQDAIENAIAKDLEDPQDPVVDPPISP